MKQERLSNEVLSTLCMSLAHQLHAGIGMGDALDLMARDESAAGLGRILSSMARQADQGAAPAQVFRSAGCFPHYVCSLLEAGQQVGRVPETLEALARHYDGRQRLTRRLRSAVLYPSLLAVVMLVVVAALLVWVLPVFNEVYGLMGSRLTGLAGGLLLLGDVLKGILPVLGLLLVLTAAVLALPGVRERLKTLWRKQRGIRGVSGKIQTARFAQALSLGLGSGMTAQEAMGLAMTLTEDVPAFRRRCEACLAAMEAGDTLPAALGKGELLSKADCRLLDAGIRSGRGETVMDAISRRLLEDSETALEEAVGRIEPTLVLVSSVLVGVILLAVMLPLMHIMAGIG